MTVSGAEITVPLGALSLLAEAMTQLAAGRALQLVSFPASLRAEHAADLLGVSRSHVMALLERGDLPSQMVDGHNRVRFEDLVAYRNNVRKAQKRAADVMLQQAQADGQLE